MLPSFDRLRVRRVPVDKDGGLKEIQKLGVPRSFAFLFVMKLTVEYYLVSICFVNYGLLIFSGNFLHLRHNSIFKGMALQYLQCKLIISYCGVRFTKFSIGASNITGTECSSLFFTQLRKLLGSFCKMF